MDVRTFLLSVSFSVLTIMGCTGGKKRVPTGSVTMNEIPRIVELVMTHAAEELERALEVIDSFRTAGLPDHETEWLRAKVYSSSLEGVWLDSAIVITERLMGWPVAKENREYREDVLETLVNACRLRHDDERALRWTAELEALCREKGEETEALRNEAEMGLYLTHVGRMQKGLTKIDSVMTRLDNVRRFNELDAWLIAAKRKITVLKESDGEYLSPNGHTDIIPIANRIIDRFSDANYFGRKFKARFGLSPTQYRSGNQPEPFADS